MLDQIEDGVASLLARRPKAGPFVAQVGTRERAEARIGSDEVVKEVSVLDITFTSTDGVTWTFDGVLAFIINELSDRSMANPWSALKGPNPLHEIVLGVIRRKHAKLAAVLVDLQVGQAMRRPSDNVVLPATMTFRLV